ncbi:hypothetical protein PLICRDRAFT_449772 [Plicaturopsis crispa FD-325 SS-3]|uniref:Unplaced genomic scaffold PLICRscaffold_24, whole genome shotgun sequence n=1 Tax=Plicaturopsis crispa FD-325 SS-3 TaxID=944288 RepID=A0A0C9T5V0_PLICR|nr:hypothetical protein PLICRDRAFT_449772 [Plicaturopsis crispa FD-325 SS-3]
MPARVDVHVVNRTSFQRTSLEAGGGAERQATTTTSSRRRPCISPARLGSAISSFLNYMSRYLRISTTATSAHLPPTPAPSREPGTGTPETKTTARDASRRLVLVASLTAPANRQPRHTIRAHRLARAVSQRMRDDETRRQPASRPRHSTHRHRLPFRRLRGPAQIATLSTRLWARRLARACETTTTGVSSSSLHSPPPPTANLATQYGPTVWHAL